ncbi:MAG: hypothetical protein M3Z49_11635, partial [Bifidobacteriales bacterium]|nr:hypothetical protein [Bifidobacteriales bacterium]
IRQAVGLSSIQTAWSQYLKNRLFPSLKNAVELVFLLSFKIFKPLLIGSVLFLQPVLGCFIRNM